MASPERGNGNEPIGVRNKSFACAVAELGTEMIALASSIKKL
jgi:hypothetical protein